MKFSRNIMAITFALGSLSLTAQVAAPKGFKTATVSLDNGSSMSGFLNEPGGKKMTYDATQVNAVNVEGVKFICINNDFFKVLSEGELNFLQKSSDAKGKVFYNGLESIVSSGTDGKPGDYFIYRNSTRELKLITNKNLNEVVSSSFQNYSAAIEKAKTANGDL